MLEHRRPAGTPQKLFGRGKVGFGYFVQESEGATLEEILD